RGPRPAAAADPAPPRGGGPRRSLRRGDATTRPPLRSCAAIRHGLDALATAVGRDAEVGVLRAHDRVVRPRDLAGALEALRDGPAGQRLLAGGTDLMVQWNQGGP